MTSLTDTIAAAESIADSVPKGVFVGGEWRGSDSGAVLAVDDPGTGRTIAEVADAGVEDGLAALSAAADAQASWAATPPRERGEILRRAFEQILVRGDDLARLMTLEMGKPLAESQAEVAYAAEFFRWFSEEAVRIDGGYLVAPGGGSRVVVTRQPVGPSLLVTPWNFPMAMGTRKIRPRSRPVARWWSSRHDRHRCRCSRWWGSSRMPACRPGWSTSSPHRGRER